MQPTDPSRSSSFLIPSLSCDTQASESTVVAGNSWTKFSDSPTTASGASGAGDLRSTQSIPDVVETTGSRSQGQQHSLDPLFPSHATQPANFDFNESSIELDPGILHPIPLRLTPEGQKMLQSLAEHPCKRFDCLLT